MTAKLLSFADADPKRLLESALAGFKINGKIAYHTRGPVLDIFDVRLPPGVRFSRVENIAEDIARAIMARSCRVTQVAAEGLVRIEAARANVETVELAAVFQNVAGWGTAALPVGLGVGVTGNATVIDLAKAPHLLIAGTTGSGKSVLLNSVILSLAAHRTPNQVRFVLCDPKRIELTQFEGLPHMLEGVPVLTDPALMVEMLQRALWEMEERNEKMRALRVRDISDMPGMPRIVIVIDELAALMSVAKEAVEDRLSRLAAMGRSAGIHLVVATQRPSREIITGVIKANFPSRVCLRVASKIDSRVVLDQNGGECLLGNGDMLYQAAAAPAPTRVHGAMISTKQIETVMAKFK